MCIFGNMLQKITWNFNQCIFGNMLQKTTRKRMDHTKRVCLEVTVEWGKWQMHSVWICVFVFAEETDRQRDTESDRERESQFGHWKDIEICGTCHKKSTFQKGFNFGWWYTKTHQNWKLSLLFSPSFGELIVVIFLWCVTKKFPRLKTLSLLFSLSLSLSFFHFNSLLNMHSVLVVHFVCWTKSDPNSLRHMHREWLNEWKKQTKSFNLSKTESVCGFSMEITLLHGRKCNVLIESSVTKKCHGTKFTACPFVAQLWSFCFLSPFWGKPIPHCVHNEFRKIWWHVTKKRKQF